MMDRRFATRLAPLNVLIAAALLGGCATTDPARVTSSDDPATAYARGEGKGKFKPYMGDFWAIRASYPTGEFQPAWVAESIEAFHAVPEGLPAGAEDMAHRAKSGKITLNLPADQFTSLGPSPMQFTGGSGGSGNVGGRVNVVISHPTNPNVAWAATDGGGVWKTTNCCTTGTIWRVTTDFPEANSIAIGELVLDPNNPDVLYAGTGDLRFGSFSFGAAGVLKSTDGGETWTALGTDVFNPYFPPLTGNFPQYQAIGQIEVDPRDSNNVIVGAKTGLYISRDGGQNWTGPCLTNPHTTQRQDITGLVTRAYPDRTELFAAVGVRGFGTTVQPDLNQNGANGIYRGTLPATGCPTDWQLVTRGDNGWPAGTGNGTPNTSIGRISLEISPSNPDVMYAKVGIATTAANIFGVYRTTDGGATWQLRAQNSAFTGCSNASVQSWYNAGLLIHPTNPDIVFASAVDAFRSTDGGQTWSNIICGYSGGVTGGFHVDHHARAFVGGDPNRLLLGSDGGVHYTENPYQSPGRPTFVQLNNTFNSIEFYGGDVTANFATATSRGAIGGAQDNGTSTVTWSTTPGPALWTMRRGGDGIHARIEPVLGQRWYASSQNGSITASTTGPAGSFTTNATPPWPAQATERRSFLTHFELYRYGGETTGCPAATGCGRMLAGSFRVWESIQGGIPASSWYPNSPDLTKNTLADRSFINQVTHAVSDPSIAIAGTNDGNVWFGFGLGQGSANSATWVNVTDGNTVLPNRPVMDVATDPLNPLVGYAAVAGFAQNTPAQPGNVFQVTCTANCASFTWRNVSGNLPNNPVNSVIVNPHIPQQVFAGTDWGLFFTNDINAPEPVWQRFGNGLPNVMIWDMTIDRGFTTLVLWTRGRGAWAWPLPTTLDGGLIFRDGFE
jgi:photosystem II stability/assembly factor-like uncharacterized protein